MDVWSILDYMEVVLSHRLAAYVSIALWIIVLVSAAFLFLTQSLDVLPIQASYNEICERNSACVKQLDAIHIAVQLGRLDWISTCLAILGAGIGMTAVFSFLFTKEKAEIEARATAHKVAKKSVDKLIEAYRTSIEERIDNELAAAWLEMESQMKRNRELLRNADISPEFGDEIARRLEDDDE